MRSFPVLFALLVACGDRPPTSPTAPEPVLPAGPPPAVRISMGFADAPLMGELSIRLTSQNPGWRYEVDLRGDGEVEHQGFLAADLTLPYTFQSPGVHTVRVRLLGADTTATIDLPVVVNDPSRIRVEAEGTVTRSSDSYFEGLAVSPDGTAIYVGDFRQGAVHRVDPVGLFTTAILPLRYGVEGLSIAPSGRFLFVGFKDNRRAARIRIPELETVPLSDSLGDWRKYFVHALDDRRALYGGGFSLQILDLPDTDIRATALRQDGLPHFSWHFAVHPSGARIAAVVRNSDGGGLVAFSLPDLLTRSTFELPPDVTPRTLAFDSKGEKLYVLAYSILSRELVGERIGAPSRLLVYDARTGVLVRDLPLGLLECHLCAANPTARSREGGYVAFEINGGALIVDTRLDLPVARVDPPNMPSASVASDPSADASFYLLNASGRLRRVAVGDP